MPNPPSARQLEILQIIRKICSENRKGATYSSICEAFGRECSAEVNALMKKEIIYKTGYLKWTKYIPAPS